MKRSALLRGRCRVRVSDDVFNKDRKQCFDIWVYAVGA
jgi:hypothetical protein